MSNDEAMDFLFGGSTPSASFNGTAPIKHVGRVKATKKVQQRAFKSREPEFWPNGDPKMQLVITLETDERDPSIEGDDGIRNLYVKGKAMTEAVRDAVKESGYRGPSLVGGKLGIVYVGDGEAAEAGMNAPKVYRAKFEPPSDTEALDDLANREQAPQPASYDSDEEPF